MCVFVHILHSMNRQPVLLAFKWWEGLGKNWQVNYLMAHLDNKKMLNNYERLVMDEIKAWREKLIEAWLYRFFVNFLPLEQYLLAQMCSLEGKTGK